MEIHGAEDDSRILEDEDSLAKNRLERAKRLIPIVKLGDPITYGPCHQGWEEVIIRAADVLNSNGARLRPLFDKIEDDGGLRQHLGGFKGKITLSSIMPDKMIVGMDAWDYAYLINLLGVDNYLTPDGETYLRRERIAEREIERILKDTEYLIDNCEKSTPMGLVKGSNVRQVEGHANWLSTHGIRRMVFHSGDYLNKAHKDEIMEAHIFARVIRSYADEFYAYGVGSRRNLHRFAFADGFMTHSHFENAFYRNKMVNGKWIPSGIKANVQTVTDNLRAINREVLKIGARTGLWKWIQADTETVPEILNYEENDYR